MRINTNIASMTAQENASNVNKNLSSSLEKLSSGLRINKAADDASGMSIADKLRTQASSIGQGISNANSANALIQIADKAMAEQSNILDIVKTKLIQASTETTSAEGREAIRKDVSKLLEQLDNIANQTNYNGINLLNEAGKDFNFQVGEDASFDIGMTTAYSATTDGLGSTEQVFVDENSVLNYTSGALRLAAEDTSITVGYSYSAGNAAVSSQSGAVVINGAAYTAADMKSSFDIESATNVQQIVLTNSSTASGSVTIETDDAEMRNVLNAMVADNANLTKNADGNYTLSTDFSNGTNAILDFGTDKIDISKLSFSDVDNTTGGSASDKITIVTDDEFTVTKTGGTNSISVDSTYANTTAGVGGTVLTADSGQLVGAGSATAAGIVYSAANGPVIDQGSATVEVNSMSAGVINSGIRIENTDSSNETSYTLNADNVEKISMTSGSVVVTTDDAATAAALDDLAKIDNDLTKISDGTYTFAATASGADGVLDFGENTVNLKDLKITGVSNTDVLAVQTDSSVTVTKNVGSQVGDIQLSSASFATTGLSTEAGTIKGATTDITKISESLSALKNLGENELTSDIANSFMSIVDTALNQINTVRSDFGSTQNQLDSAIRNMMTTQTNIKAAESVIRDVDYAAESANFNKQNIIAQAGTYAMSQANAVQQNVMRLLQ